MGRRSGRVTLLVINLESAYADTKAWVSQLHSKGRGASHEGLHGVPLSPLSSVGCLRWSGGFSTNFNPKRRCR